MEDKNNFEYDLVKYKLTSDALNIALWDINSVDSIPIMPDAKVTWSKEFRQMLGFDDENDFPGVLGSMLMRVHPDDVRVASSVADAHLLDKTGKTPFDFECRIMLKNGDYRYFRNFATSLRDSDGNPLRVAGALMDINEKKQRDNILQAVNKTSALLLTTDDSENIDAPLMAGMELIGNSIDVDRVHIWQITHKKGYEEFIHTYCWCSEIGKQKVQMPTGVSFPLEDKLDFIELFKTGRIIRDSISSMKENEREFFNKFDVKSTVIIPLFLNEILWGIFTVDDCVRERDFTDEEVAILKSISLMMASAINSRSLRKELREAQERAMHRLEKLVEDRTHELSLQLSALGEAERKIKYSYDYSQRLTDALAIITKSPSISSGDLNSVSEMLVKEGCIAMNTSRIGVWRVSESGSHLTSISCYDSQVSDYLMQDDFDLLNRKDYVQMLHSMRLIVSNDVKTMDYDLFYDGYSPNACAVLDAPIHIDGDLFGVICVEQDYCDDYPICREWLPVEQNFTSSLADLMALAITGYERRKARDAAEHANQAKSTFLANMSHEIRTPMNSILGVTDILLQKEILPSDIEDGLNRIYTSSDMLLGIINDILDFSKIEAGKMEIVSAEYITASLINDSVQLNMTRIYDKQIDFEVQVDEKIPATLIGDELRIKQIINNLLSNAFKFTDSGKVSLSIVSEPIEDRDQITLVLIVRDTGRGMTEEQLESLYDEYSRFDKSDGVAVEGTGLGLAITHRLIALMNGGIKVVSEPGVGSVFTVRIPQKTINGEVLGREVAEHLRHFRMNYVSRNRRGQIVREPMPYGSVLLVDDVESNIYVAVGLLKPYAVQIESVMSGKEVIDLVNDGKKYDIIFMDQMMPEMDGIETTKRIRDLGYTHPVVALTANAVAGQSEKFLNNGFDEFISKPIDLRQLNTVLNKHIRDKYPSEIVESARQKQADTSTELTNDNTHGHNPPDINIFSAYIDGLDIVKGVQQHAGDKKYYLTVLRSYLSSLESILSDVDNISVDMLSEYKLKMHSIKGASKSIFSEKLGRYAADLEQAAENNDLGFIEKHNQVFIDTAQKLIDDIGSFLSEIDSDDTKPLKDKPDINLLNELLTACKESKIREADDIMDKIDEYQYDSDDGLAAWLLEHINLMNYAQVVEKLTNILAQL